MTGSEPAYSAWEGGWGHPGAFEPVRKIVVLLHVWYEVVRSDPVPFGMTCDIGRNIDATTSHMPTHRREVQCCSRLLDSYAVSLIVL